jgi:serine phosphatase RsbU (regulator of sigma subunit)
MKQSGTNIDTVIYLFFFLVSLSAFSGCTNEKELPLASEGVLDARSYDFEKRGKLPVSGDWEFYWKQLLTPDYFGDDLAKKGYRQSLLSGYFPVPGVWNFYEVNGKNLPGNGYSTYRVKVILPENMNGAGLYISDIPVSHRIWVNKIDSGQLGKMGKNKQQTIPYRYPYTISTDPTDDTVDIIIQVANFSLRKGGLWNEMYIGTKEQIDHYKELQTAFQLFLAGSLLIMALYHLGLFLLRRSDLSTLIFGLFCIVMCLRILLTGQMFFQKYLDFIPYSAWLRLEYMTFYMGVPLFSAFIYTLFPRFLHKRILIIITTLSSLFSLFVLLTPMTVFVHTLVPYQVFTLVACFYTLYVLTRSVIAQMEGSIIFLSGFILLAITAVIDIMAANHLVLVTNTVPIGVFFFFFSQSLLLSIRFSKSFKMVEDLSLNLENKVKARTKKLEETNQMIVESINYASMIQASILPERSMLFDYLSDYFLIWKPRDIVGGDFYWFNPVNDGFLLAVADCTGHGVPGAFMTMIASSILDRIAGYMTVTDPAVILRDLNHLLKASLKKESASNLADDGLDIGICYYRYEDQRVVYAGTGISLFHIFDGTVNEYRGNKRGIGYQRTPDNQDFSNNEISVDPGDLLVITTDGFYDQAGGKNGYPMGRNTFKKILTKHAGCTLDKFKQLLLDELARYQGEEQQRDDISMIGFRCL